MNRIRLFRLLRHNNHLSYRRSPAFEQSMVARVMMYLGAGLAGAYLIFLGVVMSLAANESAHPGAIFGILPIFLIIDFGSRFAIQQTPAMLVKPYLLLPMPRHAVIESFLTSSVLSGYNMLWLTLFVPYSILVFAGGASLPVAVSVLLCGMLLVMVNSQWYLMVRTLVARSLLWWLLPVAVYAAYVAPLLLGDEVKVFETMFDAISEAGAAWWFPLLCVALLAALLWLNRRMQFAFVFEEIANEQKTEGAMTRVSQFRFLERFGQTGEYLKLELKSIMRNKAIRARVLMSLGLIVVLSALITYTDVYDNRMLLDFWCYYCFGIYGMTALVKVMGPEGNYIDLLMTQRENILALLRAKYFFHVAIVIVPFVIMLPAVFAGKFSILMMTAYATLSTGVLYFTLFQLAVYNKQTLPLNQKITGKNNVENGLQLVIELCAMFAPILFVAVMLLLFSDTVAYVCMIAVGTLFTLLHPLWLRNIYNRMMRRKYELLEGFHASR